MWVALAFPLNKVVGLLVSQDKSMRTVLDMYGQIQNYTFYHIATDGMKAYKAIEPYCQVHTNIKRFTTHVESFNCRIRNYLARFNRRTLKFTRSMECAMNELQALAILDNKKIKSFTQFKELFPFLNQNMSKTNLFTQKVS